MNCTTFKDWLVDSDAFESNASAKAMKHVEACPDCKRLHDLDQTLETCLKKTLTSVEVPDRLLARIENDQLSYQKKLRSRSLWIKSFIPMAMAAMLVLFIFPSGEKFVSADQIADYAVNDHINRPKLAFKAGEVKNIPDWFEKKAGYRVVLPEKAVSGYEMRGGTKCKFGKNNAAFFCYHKKGKRYSLFVINIEDIGFDINDQEKLTLARKDCKVNIWKEADLLYAMVE